MINQHRGDRRDAGDGVILMNITNGVGHFTPSSGSGGNTNC